MSNKTKNLSYNSREPEKKCFNGGLRRAFCDTARQITDNDCARSEEIIQELIRTTRENLDNENNLL